MDKIENRTFDQLRVGNRSGASAARTKLVDCPVRPHVHRRVNACYPYLGS